MSILHLASPWTAWPRVTIVAGCSRGHHRPSTGVRTAWRAVARHCHPHRQDRTSRASTANWRPLTAARRSAGPASSGWS